MIGVAALAVFFIVGISIVTYLFVKKAEQVARNPLSAIVQIAAAANPDIEVLDVNENTGKVTIRDRKSNKTVTIDGDAIKDGRISVDTEDGHAVFGSGANVKTPSWVYMPPGAKIVGGMTADGKDGAGGTVMFTSSEPLESLKSFFEDKYKSAGYEQSVSAISTTSGDQAIQLVFQHENRKRSVTISAAKSGGTIIFAESH